MNTTTTTLKAHLRLGQVLIHDDLLRKAIFDGSAAAIFAGSVPLNVVRNWYNKTSSYLLWHPAFEECPEAQIVPHYHAVITKTKGGEVVVAQWQQLPFGTEPKPITIATLEGGAA